MNEARNLRRRYNELAGTDLGRLAGIGDGIFAVAMTLLVLGLAVPAATRVHSESDLWQAMRTMGPSLLVYVMSFMTLGIFWVGHGTQVAQLARSNRHYAWIQLAFLFAVTLVPFSTALLAQFSSYHLALIEYWLNIALMGLMLLVSLEYGLRARLFNEDVRREAARLIRGRILIAQLLYAIAVAVSLVLPVWVSILLIVLIQLNYVIAPRIPILDRF